MLGETVLDAPALEHARWRGTPLLTRRRARVAAEGILVVGDAAGYVEPFTGEGMTWALSTGAAAGTLAATHAAPHQVWPRRYAALTRAPRLRCALLSRTLRAPRLVRAMLAVGERFPLPFASFARSLGRTSHACDHRSASTA
jgi:flavin-dependent dehydrogenase